MKDKARTEGPPSMMETVLIAVIAACAMFITVREASGQTPERSGKQVVEQVCGTCHASGARGLQHQQVVDHGVEQGLFVRRQLLGGAGPAFHRLGLARQLLLEVVALDGLAVDRRDDVRVLRLFGLPRARRGQQKKARHAPEHGHGL